MSIAFDNLFGSFLDPRSVALAQLFTEVKDPVSNYFNPTTPVPLQQSITRTNNGSFASSKDFSGDLNGTLSSLLGLTLSHLKAGNISITFSELDNVELLQQGDTSNALFAKPEVRNWIQDQWRRNEHVYMVTGYMLATGIHDAEGGNASTTASVNASGLLGADGAAAAVAKLAVGDPGALSASFKAGTQDKTTGSLVLDVINSSIVAVTYREVHILPMTTSWFDHIEAKFRSVGNIQADKFTLSDEEAVASYLPTRG